MADKKEISEAIEYAASKGWRVEAAGGRGHAWGRMYCTYKDGNCRCGELVEHTQKLRQSGLWSITVRAGRLLIIQRFYKDNF